MVFTSKEEIARGGLEMRAHLGFFLEHSPLALSHHDIFIQDHTTFWYKAIWSEGEKRGRQEGTS
jgi:hypothetical protein